MGFPWYSLAAPAPEASPYVALRPAQPGDIPLTPVPDESQDSTPPSTDPPFAPPRGYTSLANPAVGQTLRGTSEDPLSIFSRRPIDQFVVPEGGLFMDPLHNDPHYGVDYTYPDDYLNSRPIWVYAIGPGYVTTRSTCIMCFVDGDSQGQVPYKSSRYNFGFGDLVVIETPFSADVSIYVMYAHLKRDFVSLGDFVTAADIIGVAGRTGYAEEIHVHLEIRYGAPGRFWNADFHQPETLDRWLATMFINPALVVFPENHPLFLDALHEWAALRPIPAELP